MLSSYSFRRCQPIIADIRNAPWEERLAVGDWKGESNPPSNAKPANRMPIAFAGRKEESAEFVKLIQ